MATRKPEPSSLRTLVLLLLAVLLVTAVIRATGHVSVWNVFPFLAVFFVSWKAHRSAIDAERTQQRQRE